MRTKTTNRANLIKKIAVNNASSQEASEVLEKTLEEIEKALTGGALMVWSLQLWLAKTKLALKN